MESIAGAIFAIVGVGVGVGVVVGALLQAQTSRGQSVRQLYLDAIKDVAFISAAATFPTTTNIAGNPDAAASARLREVMLEANREAIVNVKRSLAALVPYSDRAHELLRDVGRLEKSDAADSAIAMLTAESRLRPWPRWRSRGPGRAK